nr:E3l protein [Lemur mastadenovirus]
MSLSTFRRHRKHYSRMSLINREESDETTPRCRLQHFFLTYFGGRLHRSIKNLMKLIFLMSVISLLHAYPIDYSGSGSGDGSDYDAEPEGFLRPPHEDDEDAFDEEAGYSVFFRKPGEEMTFFCFDPEGDVEVFAWYKDGDMIALAQAGDPYYDLVHPNFTIPYHDETTIFLDIAKFEPEYEGEYKCLLDYSTEKNVSFQLFYLFNADAFPQYFDNETFSEEQKDQENSVEYPPSAPVVGAVMAIIGIAFFVACVFMVAEHKRRVRIRGRAPKIIYTACFLLISLQLVTAEQEILDYQFGFAHEDGEVHCDFTETGTPTSFSVYKRYGQGQILLMGTTTPDNTHPNIPSRSRTSNIYANSDSCSILIKKLQFSDSGKYECRFYFTKDDDRQATYIYTTYVNFTVIERPPTQPPPEPFGSPEGLQIELFVIIGLQAFIIISLILYIIIAKMVNKKKTYYTAQPNSESRKSSKLSSWCAICLICTCLPLSVESDPLYDQTGILGQPSTITCRFKWNITADIKRYSLYKDMDCVGMYPPDHETPIISDNFNYTVDENTKVTTLQIKKTKASDEGLYQCMYVVYPSVNHYVSYTYYVDFKVETQPLTSPKHQAMMLPSTLSLTPQPSSPPAYYPTVELWVYIGFLSLVTILMIILTAVKVNELNPSHNNSHSSKPCWLAICVICCVLPSSLGHYSTVIGVVGQPSDIRCNFERKGQADDFYLCRYYSNDALGCWHNDKARQTYTIFTKNYTDFYSNLHIKTTTKSDAGIYECVMNFITDKNKIEGVRYKFNFEVIDPPITETYMLPIPEARNLPLSHSSSPGLFIFIGVVSACLLCGLMLTVYKFLSQKSKNQSVKIPPWMAICVICCALPSLGHSFNQTDLPIAVQVGYEGETSEIICRLPAEDNRLVSAYFIKKIDNETVACWGHHRQCSLNFHIDHGQQSIHLHIQNTTLDDEGRYQCTFIFYSNKSRRYRFDEIYFKVITEKPTTSPPPPLSSQVQTSFATVLLSPTESTAESAVTGKPEPRILKAPQDSGFPFHWILIGLIMGSVVFGLMYTIFKNVRRQQGNHVEPCHSSANIAKMPLLAVCLIICCIPLSAAYHTVYALDGETNFMHCPYRNMSFYPERPLSAYLVKNNSIIAAFNTSETNKTKARFSTSPYIYPFCPSSAWATPYCYFMFTRPNVSDSGNYTCLFKSSKGNESYDINYQVRPKHNQIQTSVGQHMFLKCGYRDLLIHSSLWYHNNSKISLTGTRMLIHGSNNHHEKNHYLFVGTVQPSDAGNYTCILNITNGNTVYAKVNITFTVQVQPKAHALPQLPQRHIYHPHNHTHHSPPLIDFSNTTFIVIVVIIAIFILALAIICLIWYFWVWRKTLHIMDQPRNAYRRAPSPTAGLNMPLMCIMICGCLLQPVSANLTSPQQTSDLVLAFSVVGVILTVTIVLLAALNLAARRDGDGGDRNSSDSEPEYYDSDPEYDPDDPYSKSL